MTHNLTSIFQIMTRSVPALLLSCASFSAVPALGSENRSAQVPAEVTERLEAFVTVYTNVYFALGACDGFIAPQQEAPFDPYGPALAKWPDSFKRQMAETREEGRIESARLARQHRFTFEERAELCRRQLDSANADLDRVRTRYGDSR
jgi:hypothetical protein